MDLNKVDDGVTTLRDLVKLGLSSWKAVQWTERDGSPSPDLKVIKCGNVRMFTPSASRPDANITDEELKSYLIERLDYKISKSSNRSVDLYMSEGGGADLSDLV